MAEKKNDPLSDYKGFFEELQKESPRAAVILAGAFLDAQLRNLLSKFLVDDPKIVDKLIGSERPLSTFGSRILSAYSLGLIGRMMYDDLETIRKIRNRFAHRMHGYSFDDRQIVDWCNELRLAKMITKTIPPLQLTHEDIFNISVTQLTMWLGMMTLRADQERRTVPPDPQMGQLES